MQKLFKENKNRIILFFIMLFVLWFIKYGEAFLYKSVNEKRLSDFFTLFFGLIVEATPFVIIGVIVSIIVGIFFKDEWLLNLIPKNRILSHFFLSIFGIFMPVCECGNVPVLRRLMLKGFKLSHAVTFLLAAPIVNPITAWSTYIAFRDIEPSVLPIRIISALIIANVVGIILSFKKNDEDFLTKEFYEEVCNHDHDHDHDHNKLVKALNIFHDEFMSVFKMLLVGATLAALSQVLIPRSIILEIGQNPILAVVAMILFSFVISICANVDAFLAASYVNTFTIGSLLSFMVFGPMIDIKMIMMLRKTFKMKLILIITVLVFVSAVIVGLLTNLLI